MIRLYTPRPDTAGHTTLGRWDWESLCRTLAEIEAEPFTMIVEAADDQATVECLYIAIRDHVRAALQKAGFNPNRFLVFPVPRVRTYHREEDGSVADWNEGAWFVNIHLVGSDAVTTEEEPPTIAEKVDS